MTAAKAYSNNNNNISLEDGTRQEDADNWPVKCICNLCDCGDHRCSTFGLLELDGQPGGGRLSSQGRPMAAADESTTGRHQCNYNCGQSNERYLTTGGGGGGGASSRSTPAGGLKSPLPGRHNINNNNNRSSMEQAAEMRKKDEEEDEDEELLHVLVTRPEIAGRPRDNIVFEGDMDLRTTFETTYEALARKRLESWRRHQQMQAERKVAGESDGGGGHHHHQLDVSVVDANKAAVSGGRAKREVAEEGGLDDHQQQSTTTSRRQSPRPGTGTGSMAAPPPPARPLKSRPTQHKEQPQPQQQQQPVEAQAKPRRAPQTAKASGRAANQPTDDDQFIDPDLSPIIVYDANMNRLERVGIRKRSKYRPSTSLRSGARGLFGDQREPTGATQQDNQQDQQQDQQQRQQVADKASPRPAAGLSSRGAHYNDRSSPTPITPDMVALEARQALGLHYSDRNLPVDTKRKNLDNINMIDHIRDMESPRPTSKHIKEVSSAGQATAAAASEDTKGELASETSGQPEQGADLKDAAVQVARRPISSASLAAGQAPDVEDDDLDEAAAVAEIQRCTLRSPMPGQQQEPPTRELSRHTRDTQQQQQQREEANGQLLPPTGRPSSRQATPPTAAGPSKDGKGPGGSPSISELKQSKLQRTCQNQSFYIYENEYPEPRKAAEMSYYKLTPIDGELELGGTGKAYSKANSPAEGQRRRLIVAKRNNLFRESPDSTLNVGASNRHRKSMGTSKDQQQQQQVDNKLEGRETRTRGRIRRSAEGGDQTSADPRASNDFDYYNTKSGVLSTTPTPTGLARRDSDSRSASRHTCKVLLLDRDFDFVGHHLGHNYFVEKQLNANEIYERQAPDVTNTATLVQ